MNALRSQLGLVGTLVLTVLPASAGAQAVGSEFQVNTYTTGSQRANGKHVVAADANGNFIVVWVSFGQDGAGYGIFGQRYDKEGIRRGQEFQVNSQTLKWQRAPSVSSDASGNFVVV